jgi:hypothetical protein
MCLTEPARYFSIIHSLADRLELPYKLTMIEQSTHMRKRPLGIAVLALLMFLIGGVWLLVGLALPLLGAPMAPWYIALGAAAYFLAIGWGLWGLQRWAYIAALLMCAVLGFYQLQSGIVLGQNVLVPTLLLLVILGYLLLPRVRAVFLAPGQAG